MQGFNMGRYVPPDQEGILSFNQAAKKNPVSPTVRFEMPYPIWCTTCPKPTIIGQGVRFNAYKTRVGNYYTTPIFAFRMKHVACGGWIEIRTDPKNTAYVVTEGARKRDTGEDKLKEEEGDFRIMTQEEREEMRKDAFRKLEVKVGDKVRAEEGHVRIEELLDLAEVWKDPGERNRELRRKFRVGRKEREKEAKVASGLQDKLSFGYDLVPEAEEDRRRAEYVDFGEEVKLSTDKALSKPMFTDFKKSTKVEKKSGRTKGATIAIQRRRELVSDIQSNTRLKIDPFIVDGTIGKPGSRRLPGLVKKDVEAPLVEGKTPAVGLVDYDSS